MSNISLTSSLIDSVGGDPTSRTKSTLKGVSTVAALRQIATAGLLDGDTITTSSATNISDTKGSGLWRYDASDNSSTDNLGTIVTPATGVGRWKRIYQGPINAAWFGVSPSNSDNTQALQNAVDFVGTNTYSGNPGGTLFIPSGYYRFKFASGTSGLTTISIPYENVFIEGEGRNTILRTDLTSGQHSYFFTWSETGLRGQGGGIRKIRFDGNSQLKWCVFLDAWRFWSMEDVNALDVYGGLLDACNNQTTFGENIHVNRVDVISSSGTNSCFSQYGVRFRAGSVGSWSECSIRSSLFVNIWDTGVYLDGCARFTVDQIGTGCNTTSTNTIDGQAKSGALHCVVITNSINNGSTTDTGHHSIRGIYFESHVGTETATVNQAVMIDSPASQVSGFNRYNRVEDVTISASLDPATIAIYNNSSTTALTSDNTFTGNKRGYRINQAVIGPNVVNTYLNLTPSAGNVFAISDQGTRTFINGVNNYAYSTGLYPDTTPGAGKMDVGYFSRDTNTGRVCWQDKNGVPVLLYGRPGVDTVAPYGAQRIRALGTPAAPTITRGSTGSTTYTYYWVAVDKDGNKSLPSAAATINNGPASLAGSARNLITGMPVDGAVTYDLLKGSTSTSVATGLTSPFYYDGGAGTSAYTPAASAPPGTLIVDGHFTASATATPTIAAGAAAGTSPTISISGSDQQGLITITTGTSPATGVLATVTFGNVWATAPKVPVIGPASGNAGASGAYCDASAVTTSAWTIKVDAALAASTTYKFAYQVGG